MISRRKLLAAGAVALPITATFCGPMLNRAAAAELEEVTLNLPASRETVRAVLARPEQTPAGSVVLIHEWWGLTDEVRAVASDLADQGYMALAVDLFGGQTASTPEEAQQLAASVDSNLAQETIAGWITWLRLRRDTTAAVAVLGWGFGGGWSLIASLRTPVNATIVYYGRVPTDSAVLTAVEGRVQGHFGEHDQFISASMIEGFEAALRDAGVVSELHRYDAGHSFANPSDPAYDPEAAEEAWTRTLRFLEETIGAEAGQVIGTPG